MRAIADEFSSLPSAARRWQARRKRDGKCVICGGEVVGGVRCEGCRGKQAMRYQARKVGGNGEGGGV